MIEALSERRLGFRVHQDLPWLVLAPGVLAELLLEPAWCALPGADASIYGAVNVRGAVYPVFDLVPTLAQASVPSPRLLLIESGQHGAAVAIWAEPQVGVWQKRVDATEADQASIPAYVQAIGTFSGEGAWLIDHRRCFTELGAGHTDRH